ncbi:MAG: hypothetical protein QOK40_1662, partial [Miltoncostaeaceae bacterium]|nr:hypothetical protein [Miltoncostaeaceae bacterium]
MTFVTSADVWPPSDRSAVSGRALTRARGGAPATTTAPASPSPLTGSDGDLALAALADLATAPVDAVADRAHAALAASFAHDALVLVSPDDPSVPVRIAAPRELRERLATLDWAGLVDPRAPQGSSYRLTLPDVIGGLRAAGWVGVSGGICIALIVGAQTALAIDDAQERFAMQVTTLAAARLRGVDHDPSPGSLAFSHALSQERERVRLDLQSRHAATLSSLLQTLRRGADAGGSRATPPTVTEA